MTERLVVIGGDAGGMSAASHARRLREPESLEIVAFERGRDTSYSACGIPYYVGDVVHDIDRLVVRTPPVFRGEYDIDVRTLHEVVTIDADARTVRARDLAGGDEHTVGFDHLVIATGARPIRPPIDGIDAQGIFGVHRLDDGRTIRAAIERDRPARAVIVGAGYIGLEMAEALLLRGVQVTLVDRLAQPMDTLDPDMGALVADAIRGYGVDLRLGETVEGFEVVDGAVRGVVTSGGAIQADLVILAIGVRPDARLAEDAGLPVGETGGVVTDERMAVAPGIWAAGDCVETFHRISRRPVAIALGTHANKQGRVVGANIGGVPSTFAGVLGTAITKVCDVEIARTGLHERQAAEAGADVETFTVRANSRAGYYPGAEPMTVKLVVARGDGRLLGAQIVGGDGSAKRIDVFAAALWNAMTVADIYAMDLSYAPPFSPTLDPVVIAARRAAEALG